MSKNKVVNHWGIWVDSDTPTTGVYSIHDIAWEFADDDTCLDCEEYIESIQNNPDMDDDEKQSELEFIECDGSHTKIIGDWIKDESGQYAPDHTGVFAAIVRETTVQVVWSVTTQKGYNLCSPCYPGQCDMNSTGDFTAYTLPDYLIRLDD